MLNEIKDRYTFRIEREIAKGGMGTIYEATQLGTDGFEKRVAIKTLLPAMSQNPKFIEMFIGEGRLVADLVHENIVQIYQLARGKAGYHIVMEYVHGLSLHDFIGFHGATKMQIPSELAVFITSRLARGLAYAHSRLDREGRPLNIVHRDVCPTNIMITTEGLPKLMDFGIAKAANNIMPPHDRVLMGKLYYMSPEQAQRFTVDHRTDIYSLGMVLYELLCCKKARFQWTDEILDAAKAGWIGWESLPEGLSEDLMSILRKMLARSREERYSDTGRLAYDLEYFIYHKGYGPTVVSLENYLRDNFPYLYTLANVPRKMQAIDPSSRTIPLATADIGAETEA